MGSKEKMNSFLSRQTDETVEAAVVNTARKRVLNLLDEDSFVELGSQLLSHVKSISGREAVAGEGLISGYGQIDGRLVFVVSQDASVYQGSIGLANSRKFIRALELAEEAECPFIALLDSGGIRVDEGLEVLDAVGRIYRRLQEARPLIPLVSVVLGPCPGTLSLLPAASDITILSAEKGGIFLQGPGITAAEENPELKPADIGGTAVHGHSNGLATLSAPDETEAINLTRKILQYLPDHAGGFLWTIEGDDDPNRSELSLDELAEKMDDGYEIDTIIHNVFDKDSVLEMYPDFATELKSGLATIGGQPVLYVANNKAEMGLSSADKIEQMILLADRLNYPLITFTDTCGFASGTEMEKSAISTVAARVMDAFTSADITRINVIVGQAVGQGYLLFNSKVSGASVVYAWPTAEISVLRADSAVNLFWGKQLQDSADPIEDKKRLISQYRSAEMSPDKAMSNGAVDEIIRPSATRPRIFSALQILEGL